VSETRPITVGVMRISEPATMVTDFVIAAICVVFAVSLGRGVESVASARGLWALSFACTAIAAGTGGVVHGFALHLAPTAKDRLWKATQYVLGLTGLAMLAAAVSAFVPPPAARWLIVASVAKFALYAAALGRRDDYAIVVVDYGLSMIAVAALAAAGWARQGAPAAPWLVAGVAVSGAAAAVQLKRVAPHPRFNHNDLYHVIQVVALYLFYRGGILLVDA
jgi:hypothetical protein